MYIEREREREREIVECQRTPRKYSSESKTNLRLRDKQEKEDLFKMRPRRRVLIIRPFIRMIIIIIMFIILLIMIVP